MEQPRMGDTAPASPLCTCANVDRLCRGMCLVVKSCAVLTCRCWAAPAACSGAASSATCWRHAPPSAAPAAHQARFQEVEVTGRTAGSQGTGALVRQEALQHARCATCAAHLNGCHLIRLRATLLLPVRLLCRCKRLQQPLRVLRPPELNHQA